MPESHCADLEDCYPCAPQQVKELADCLREVEPRRLVGPGMYRTRYQCATCQQIWDFTQESVGHQDWDWTTCKFPPVERLPIPRVFPFARAECCDTRPRAYSLPPQKIQGLWPLLEVVKQNKTALVSFVCRRCGQNWGYDRTFNPEAQAWSFDTHKSS